MAEIIADEYTVSSFITRMEMRGEGMAREIKVKIKGEISDYNIELFNRQLAITLMKELGTEKCGILLDLLNQKELESNKG